ncbi:MAG: DUF2147 domain-containing protein [Acetobacter sp.]|nr:DUF2147 domain-containing protein [Acetobacter sp.]
MVCRDMQASRSLQSLFPRFKMAPLMKYLPLFLFLVTGLFYTLPAEAEAPPEIGLWLSEKHDGVFRVEYCGDGVLCGTLIGMRYDEAEPARDVHGRSECGLTMLTGFRKKSGDERWNGKILDPDSGEVYHAQIWSPRDGEMKLRGYVGIPLFGETQTWTRYTGTIGAQCRLPPE